MAELHTADIRHLELVAGYVGDLSGSLYERRISVEGCLL